MSIHLDKVKSRGIFLVIAFFAIFVLTESAYRVNMLETAEHLYSDLWHRLSGARYTPQHVVLVAVDDQSLAKFSDDPLVFWTPLFARAISTLRKVGVPVIGVDFLFAVTPEKWLNKLQLTGTDKLHNYDLPFREQLGSGQVVLAGSRIKGGGKQQDTLLLPHQDYLLSLPDFDLVSHIGYADLLPDPDGGVRRYEITPRLDLAPELAEGAPSFTLGALLALRVSKHQQLAGNQWQIGSHTISAAQQANISYAGPPGTFSKIPISTLLAENAENNPEVRALQGKVVIIGGDFFGMNDVHSTPYSGSMAGGLMTGPEIQANIVETLLSGKATESVPLWARWAVFAGLIGMSLIAYTRMSPWLGLGVLAGCSVVALLLAMLLFKFFYLFPAAHLQFGLVAGYMLSYGRRLTAVEREKNRIRSMFGQYIPPELVEEMVEKGEDNFSMEGQNREMTVLFSDVRGFTMMSEGMDPKQLSQMMNVFLTLLTQVIHSHRGTIDKYMGDAIMAFWGAPLEDPEHAKHALLAALDMTESLGMLREKFKERGWPEIRIGVGLNSGQMTFGNMGSVFRMAYTVVGDSVNLGARLEALTRHYGSDIIVSEFTKDQVPDLIFRELDCVRVKGKGKPVFIYEPVCETGMESKEIMDELKLHREALKLYRARNWDMAELHFLNLQKMSPQRYLYQMYIKRMAYFRENPPEENWDGVFTFETK